MATIQVSPGESIQEAINAAVDGDIIIVSPGTYTEILTITDKNITLASEFYTTGDSDLINQTIIDGVVVGRDGSDIITVSGSSGTNIIGFTIQNGDDGIQLDDSSNVEIVNNRIINTIDATDFKGTSSGIIRNNILENNTDDGVDLNSEAAAVVENNIIRNNEGDGLEIRLQPYSGATLEVIIRDNLISGNSSDGIQLIDSDDLSDRYIRIEGNRIEENNQAGLGLMDNGVTREDYRAASIPEPIDVINNTFIGNNHGLTGGDNLVALNNLFVGHTNIAMKGVDGDSVAAYNLFWNNGTDTQGSNVDTDTTVFDEDPLLDSNSQLQVGSPAIDAGIAFFEWRGETVLDSSSFNGASLDIGAFESDFTPPSGADLELNQVVNNATPTGGEEVIFTLTLENKGPDDTTNVAVTDSLPAGLTFESAAPSQGTNYDSTNGVWSVGTVNSGSDATLELVATVQTTPTTVITNTAEVTASSEIDPDSTPNNNNPNEDDQASASIEPNVVTVTSRVSSSTDDAEERATGSVILSSSDLELVFDGSNQSVGTRFNNVNVPRGVTITDAYIQFQVDETNTGTTNLTIQGQAIDNAPTFTTATNSISSRNKTSASVTWAPAAWNTVGAAGADQRTSNIASVIQEIINRPGWASGNSLATIITGTGERTAESFNGDAAGAPLLHIEYIDQPPPAVDTADLSLSTSVDNSNPTSGEPITFTVTLTNEGPDAATGVTVTDSLPAELSFVSSNPSPGTTYDSNTGIWNVGTVDNGTELTLEITANVPNTGMNTYTAEVTASDQPDSDSTPGNGVASEDDQDNVSFTVVTPGADLELSKTVDLANPSIGDNITFTLTLNNFGPLDATNVEIADLLPTGLDFVSATASQGIYNSDTGIWDVGDISNTSSSERISFAAFGDYGRDSQSEADVANLVNILDPDFIVTTGDNSYGSNPIDLNIGQYYSNYIGDYQGTFGVGSVVNQFFPSLGNHDYTDGGGLNAYLDYFNLPGTGIGSSNTSGNERYYDFVQGPIHFFAINANGGEPDGRTSTSIQAQWLEEQLAASTSPWKIVYMHQSPYSSSEQHGSQPILQWPFEDWGVTAVLSGHDHIYERIVRDDNNDNIDLPYFVTGIGGVNAIYAFSSNPVSGSEARYNNDFGTMLVEADENSINFEFHSLSEGVVDTYTINNTQTVETATLEIVANVTSEGTFTNTAEVTASDQDDPDSTPNNNNPSEDDQDSVVVTVGGSGGSSVFETRVSSSTDDAEESVADGDMYLNSSDLELINDDGIDQLVGMRFTNVSIPQGATISNAYIQFQVDETTSDPTQVNIQGEDVDDALTFSNSDFNISSRATTDAVVAWTPSPWTTRGEAGFDQQTPDIAAVIQEIVDRPGWGINNSLAIIIDGTGERIAESYNGDQLGAPLLHVEWFDL